MFRKTLLALILTFSGLVHAQIPISGLPNATVPLGATDKIIVNQPVSPTVYSTRQAPLSALAPFFPSINSHYVLQAPDPLLPQSRTLVGTANQVIISDGGALGNLTLSLPQSVCTTCGPTFANLTLTGVFNGFSGLFSSTLQSNGYTGTTGSFSGALSAGSFSLTIPLPATSGGTGFGSYAVGDLLSASTTTALSKLSDVAVGSYLRSGGVNTLPLWSTLTLPNAATTGDILYATSANAIGNFPDVAAGSYLRSGGVSTVPLYSTVKIPNTDALGDLWVGSSTNNMTALAGNITTTKQFLTQTGTGAVSASPAWGTIAAGDLPGSFSGFANPSGLIGLTAANGVATTATRSDATHALDQSISPTWTGTHSFNNQVTGTATSAVGVTTFRASAVTPVYGWKATGGTTDTKNWQAYATGSGVINFSALNDAETAEKIWLTASRTSGTTTIASIGLGNSTDKPPITLNGPVIIPAPSGASALTLTGVASATLFAETINTSTTAGQSLGLRVFAGTNSADNSMLLQNAAGTLSFINVRGNGAVEMAQLAATSVAQTGTVCWASGAGNLTVDTTVACLASSIRWKEKIKPLDLGLSAVLRFRPISYDLKPEFNSQHLGRQVGLIAEEVQKIDPRLVALDDDGQPRGVRYMQLTAVLVKAIQQQQIEIYALWIVLIGSFGFTFYRTRRG